MKTIRVVMGLAVAGLVLAGCGESAEDATGDLRESLRQAHEFDNGYELLGDVQFADNTVTVNSEPWADAQSGAQFYCEWVSEWLYSRGDPDARVVVNVPGRNGEDPFSLTRRGESEDCAQATLNGS